MSEAQKYIRNAVSRIVQEYLFPGDTCCTPDVVTQVRADKLALRLIERLTELAKEGIDGTEMTWQELLPGYDPATEPLTDADYDAFC